MTSTTYRHPILTPGTPQNLWLRNRAAQRLAAMADPRNSPQQPAQVQPPAPQVQQPAPVAPSQIALVLK